MQKVSDQVMTARFFTLVRELGFLPSSIARRIGVSYNTYWRLETGRTPMSAEFVGRATAVLRDEVRVRKEDGTPYTVAELFFDGPTAAIENGRKHALRT